MGNLKVVVDPLLEASLSDVIAQLPVICLAGSILYFLILRPIYLLTFHPLAKYPGPVLYKISCWPFVYQTYKLNRHLHNFRDHQRYGPVVRTGPNSLSFCTDTALDAVYGSKDANVRKSDFYKAIDSAAGDGALSTFSEPDKHKHAVRRRILGHAFSHSAIRSAELYILQNVTKFCTLLGPREEGDGWSEKRNMCDWANWLAYDVIGDLAFGKCFNCLDGTENRHLPRSLTDSAKFTNWLGYVPSFTLLLPFITSRFVVWLGGKTAEENAYIVEYAGEQFDARKHAEEQAKERGEPPVRKDVMHYLLNSQDPKSGVRPTEAEMRSDSLLLIGAGADAPATTISAAYFYLLHNPDTLRKAESEVRSTFADLSEIKGGPKLNSCVYLQACIDETLRRAPPVPSALPRQVLPGGAEIDGQRVPAGTVVGVSAYAIHHDSTYFPEPMRFVPERWIPDATTGVTRESVSRARRAFCAFSLGSRGCLGKALGYLEVKTALAYLLFEYDVREAEDERIGGGWPGLEEGRHRPDEYQLEECFGVDRKGPVVQFRKRQQGNGE